MDIKETNINRIQGEKIVNVYTCETKYINKLNKLQEEYPNLVKLTIYPDGIEAEVPADWFKFVSPKRNSNMSEEQKEKMRERMANARAKKKENT